jgi:hypothetical protein
MGAAHSKIGASSAYRWMACPGSVALSANIENKSSSFADEGTRAHELAEKCLAAGRRADSRDFSPTVDREMVDAVNTYIDAVNAELEAVGGTLWVEQRFQLRHVDEDCFGTSDAVIYSHSKSLLHIFDLKYGKGVPVSPIENPQALYYALGAFTTLNQPVDTVKITIVQPRCEGGGGTWETDAWRLVEFTAELKDAIGRVRAKDAPLSAGKHCQFCPAAKWSGEGFLCPELEKQALLTASHDFETVDLTQPPPAPEGMDSAELGRRLKQVQLLRLYASRLDSYAYQQALQGRIPEGFGWEPKRATRSFKDPEEAKSKFRQWFPDQFDELVTTELKSPAQVEKVLGRRHKNDIADLIESKSSGMKLVPLSAGDDAVSEFETIEWEL